MDPHPTFALIAELSVGLAGFAGVAAAFGGSERSYAPVGISRLQSLFAHAFLAFSISLFTISLLSFNLGPQTSTFWPSAGGALAQALVAGFFIPRAYRYAPDPTASPGWWGFGVSSASMGSSFLMLGASTVSGGSVGLLVSAASESSSSGHGSSFGC